MSVSLNLKNGSVGQSTSNYSWLSHTKDNLTAELRVGVDSNNQRYINGIADYISLPKTIIKKQDNNLEGGEIHFESADNAVNAGKAVVIDRYDSNIRIVGQNSSGDWAIPFRADIQNNRNYMTNATFSGDFRIEAAAGAAGFGLQLRDNTSRNNISVLNYITSDGKSYGRFLNTAYDKNCYIDVTISSAGERTINLSNCDYSYTRTPVSSSNSTDIATTNWVRTRMNRAVGKTGPTTITTLYNAGQATGDITLSQPFTNFDAIYIWFAGDNNADTLTKLWYTWELDRVLKDSMHTNILLFNAISAYWYVYNYANGSTTSMFKNRTENCYVNRIDGLIW